MTRALIEEQLPLALVNAQSALEKHLRHGNISTMHLWWARRPLAMARTVVFASLVPDPGDDQARDRLLGKIAAGAPFKAVSKGTTVRPLRDELTQAWPGRRPRVLDCFAGGGAIPLEAARLGCEVTATDINPVAHLIQRCVLEYPARYGAVKDGRRTFVDDFTRWAEWVKRHADERLRSVFPQTENSGRVAAYFWARTIPCADQRCGRSIPLISSRKLANTNLRKVRVDYDPRPNRIELRVAIGEPNDGSDWSKGTKTSRGSSVTVTCPVCSTSRPDRELRNYARQYGFGHYLYAVMEVRGTGDRHYREPTPAELDAADKALALLDELVDYADGTTAIPDEPLVTSQYRTLRPLTFGMDTWRSMFTSRQQVVLGVLAQTVRAAHQEMLDNGMDFERAKALATYLGLAVDRIADYDSSLAGWLPSHEKVTHTFPQQSIRMAWDFVEIDPLTDNVSGNWDGAIRWIELALEHCCNATLGNPARVQRANAQELPFADDEFDAVIIDPPYYDAFQYGDLSDFFYVWLKRSIGHLYPDLFSTLLTPKSSEMIENRADKKSPEYISPEQFEQRLQNALNEVARVVNDDGIVSIVFAHTDAAAWGHLLRALRMAGLVVTTSWPMVSEREGRTTANIGSVLSSSVVLACRKIRARGEGFYDDVVRELEVRIEERLAVFEEMRLIGADYFVSAVGPAFEVFARYTRVVRLSGEEVDVDLLMVLARQAVARHAMRRLLGGESLTSLDNRSLFYLTWHWAYDGAAIPADEAYMLCRAFDVELEDLTRLGGMVEKRGSGGDAVYRLLGPRERERIVLGASPTLVDVMHAACRLHDQGRRKELVDLLAETGFGNEPAFWAMVSALAEMLPDGDHERALLLGIGGNREGLSEAAAQPRLDDTLALDLGI